MSNSLLDTWSQATHVSYDFCNEKGISIQPISQMVHIEEARGQYRLFRVYRGKVVFTYQK